MRSSLTAHAIEMDALRKAFDFEEHVKDLPTVDTGGYGSTTGQRVFAYGQCWLWANLDGYWAWFAESVALAHLDFDPAEVSAWIEEGRVFVRKTGGVIHFPPGWSPF